MKDNLQRAHARRNTIKTLVAYIRAMRAQKIKDDTFNAELVKALKKAVSKQNRRVKTLEQQVDNNKELIHLREVVKNQSKKIGEYVRIINSYEMEKL